MVKGLTPVIALVMLILITVGIVGLFYGRSSGLSSIQTENDVAIPIAVATCNNGLISFRIPAEGSMANVTDTDLIFAQINGTECTKSVLSISPNHGGIIISAGGCGSGCSAGTKCSGNTQIRVGTRNGIVESSAFCA